jgi:hypothetical protein
VIALAKIVMMIVIVITLRELKNVHQKKIKNPHHQIQKNAYPLLVIRNHREGVPLVEQVIQMKKKSQMMMNIHQKK